MDKSFGLKLD